DGNEVVLKDDQEVAGGTEYKVKVAENPTGSQTFSVNVLINDAPANVIEPVNVRATYTGKDPEPEPEPGFHKVYGVDFTKESALDYLVMKNVYNDDYTVMTWKNVVREGFWTLEEGKGYRPVNTDAGWTYLTKEISSLVKEGKKYVLKVTATNVQIAACQGNTNASQDAVNQGWMNEYEIAASETKEFTFTAGAASEEGYFFAVIPTAFNLGDRFTAYTYPSDEALYPYIQAIELWEEGAAPAGPAINVEYVSLPDVNKAIVTVVPTRDDTDVYYKLNGEPALYEGPVTLAWTEGLADPETGEAVFIFEALETVETEPGVITVVAESSKEIRIAKPATIGISIEYVALPEMSKAVVTLTPSVDGHILGYSFDGEEYMGYEGPVELAWMESRVKDETGDAVYEFYAAEMDGEGMMVATLYREIRVPKPAPSEWEEVLSAQLPLPQAYDEDTWSLYPAANWTVDEDGLTASDDFDWVRAGYVTLEPGVYRIKVRGNDNAKNVLFEIVDCERLTGTSGSFNELDESITRTSFNSDEDTWVYSNEFTIYETSDCRAQ
ncbi:MAG: hypothetical protein HUK12_03875, partial [Muribaculaceae bacterium]|nr:hypothetical protein [Muribaculaceae bacterium]